jgi:ribosomal-protein-alanine N-acetyltransferase
VGNASRVTVRRVRVQDEEEFIGLALQSLDFHHPWIHAPTTSSDFHHYVARLSGGLAEGWLVCVRETNAIAGFINLNEVVLGPYRRGQLGYGVFAPFAGQGYMREGLEAIVDYAFGTLNLHRLEADIQPENGRSAALVKRLGFRREGLSIGFICIDGNWMDHERWAIVKVDGKLPSSIHEH